MKARFGVPYMHCGCPLPGNTIGQRLKRLRALLDDSKPPSDLSALHPPTHPHDSAAFSGTHPSDHNSVHIEKPKSLSSHTDPVPLADARAHLMKSLRERDAKAMRKGRMDQVQYQRGEGHDFAFLTPVPFYIPVAPYGWTTDVGTGWTAGGVGVCAVVS